ncbi:MAG TPA: DNA-protecting protein DprA [Rhodopirellula sp.]|nr:MAG: DNA protecting protein DprA [Saprospirales bacterium TMED214]HBV64108.1 DNA-protecting protein DprA [Rhodopirellula sp.]
MQCGDSRDPAYSTDQSSHLFSTIHLISLAMQSGLGPCTLSALLDKFGTAKSILTASTSALLSVEGVGEKAVQQIREANDLDRAAEVLRWCERQKTKIISQMSASFPRWLGELRDAPALLYVQGELIPKDRLSVAVVGTRHATPYGLTQANRFGYGLAKAGITVVSGLARGIDAAAHRGALDAGGRTVAVLGSGLAKIYPSEHAKLSSEVSRSGAVISEYPPFCPPRCGQFPQRNRLIAGLTLGTLVVEAPDRSGALITARLAGELNRDVFALPGPINSRASRGCNQLIRDGVILVQSIEELIDELGPMSEALPTASGGSIRNSSELNLNEIENCVLNAIEPTGSLIDEVIANTPHTTQQVLAVISVLEIRHLIRRLNGQYVSRI